MLAAFTTQLPLSSPPIMQTPFIAIPDVNPEPALVTEVETVFGGMKVDSTHRSVNQ